MTTAEVLLVHGLWMTGLETWLLRHRLRDRGFDTQQFTYPSMTAETAATLLRLRERILSLPPPVHLIGHSLGGLLILRLLQADRTLPVGNVVLLGSPVNGSMAARRVGSSPFGRLVFGPLAARELLDGAPRRWDGRRPLGLIAGSLGAGLGRVIADVPAPNDGTVAVEETILEGATEHRVFDVSHTSMLVSNDVAQATANFLEYGHFDAPG